MVEYSNSLKIISNGIKTILSFSNLILFLLFGFLCLSLFYLKRKKEVKNSLDSKIQRKHYFGCILEFLFYFLIALLFLFLKNHYFLPISFISEFVYSYNNIFPINFKLISDLSFSLVYYQFVFDLILLLSLLSFIILTLGFFLTLHARDFQFIYPITFFKSEMFRKPLFIGAILTILFGFYPLTYFPLL